MRTAYRGTTGWKLLLFFPFWHFLAAIVNAALAAEEVQVSRAPPPTAAPPSTAPRRPKSPLPAHPKASRRTTCPSSQPLTQHYTLQFMSAVELG